MGDSNAHFKFEAGLSSVVSCTPKLSELVWPILLLGIISAWEKKGRWDEDGDWHEAEYGSGSR